MLIHYFKLQSFRAQLLSAVFIGSLLAANVIAFKLLNVFGWVVTAGTIAYPITFMVTDAIGEVFGKSRARRLVWAGFFAQIFFLLIVLIAKVLPYPPFFADGQKIYEQAFAAMPRIVLGSMVAYLISQLHDVWAFHWWKVKTRGKHLWIRNNASTIVSQIIDSTTFILVAFAFTLPWPVIGQMILLQYIIKIIIAAADTPAVYWAVRWLKNGEEEEVSDYSRGVV